MSKQIFRFSNHSKVGLARLSFVALATFGSLVCTSSLATPYIPPRPDQLSPFPGGMRGGHFPPGHPFNQPGAAKATGKAVKPADDTVELQHSNPMVALSGAWQTWSNAITIAPGLEKMPLYFTLENGAGGAPKFQNLRVILDKKPFLTMSDFGGSATCSRNLMGTVGVGQTGLVIQGYGPTGAKLVWRLATKKLVISAVKPDSFSLTDKVTIEGSTLPTSAANIKVFIANKPVPVINVKPKNELQLQLPSNLPGGKQDLIAEVGPLKSNVIKVTIKAAPHVYSVNFVSTAPGQPVIISGKGFSTTASENSVSIGGAGATVVSATDTELTCTVPVDLAAPQWYVPIVVTTNGMKSTENVTINLGQRVIPNEGNPEQ